jgi:hypothetical protein
VKTQIIGEEINSLKRKFIRPYSDFPVKAQLWVYKSYFLTRFCFGTPLVSTLKACSKAYRNINRVIKGKKWTEKYWGSSD